MKPENPSATHHNQPPARHQFEHEVPTVIHHPEEDMTALGRWFHHAYQDPTRFWGWVGAIVVGVFAAVFLSNYLSSNRNEASDVWSRLEVTKKPAEKVELAKEFPNSPASHWALLQAAAEFYQDGFNDLPNNKDAAGPALKKALDLFDQVAKEAPKDSLLVRQATLGKARTYEARNDLPKAIEEYKLVAKNWPNTPEAKLATSLATSLESPGAAAFYKELYAYQPAKVSLPPIGASPSLPASMTDGLPGIDLSKPAVGTPLGSGNSADPTSFPFLPPPPTTPAAGNLPALPKPEIKVEAKPAPSDTKPAPVEAPKENAASPPPAATPEAKPAAPATPSAKEAKPAPKS